MKGAPQRWGSSVSDYAENLIIGKLSFFFLFFVFFLAMLCEILVPWLGIKPVSPVVEVQSPNRWTIREVPASQHFK